MWPRVSEPYGQGCIEVHASVRPALMNLSPRAVEVNQALVLEPSRFMFNCQRKNFIRVSAHCVLCQRVHPQH